MLKGVSLLSVGGHTWQHTLPETHAEQLQLRPAPLAVNAAGADGGMAVDAPVAALQRVCVIVSPLYIRSDPFWRFADGTVRVNVLLSMLEASTQLAVNVPPSSG